MDVNVHVGENSSQSVEHLVVLKKGQGMLVVETLILQLACLIHQMLLGAGVQIVLFSAQ